MSAFLVNFFRAFAPALCVLSLCFAVVGLLLAYAGGDANQYLIFDHSADLLANYKLLLQYGFPLQKADFVYHQFFYDTGVPLLLSWLFGNPHVAYYVYIVLLASILACGVFLLARCAGAKGAAWLAYPLVALMILLIVLDSTEEVFVTAFAFRFRPGLHVFMIPLFWVALNILFAQSAANARRWAAAFFVLLLPLKYSYVIVSVWIVLPIVAGVGVALFAGWIKMGNANWKILLSVIVAVYCTEIVLRETISELLFADIVSHGAENVSFSFSQFLFVGQQFLLWAAYMARMHFLLTMIWAAFIVTAAWLLIKNIVAANIWTKKRRHKSQKRKTQNTNPYALCAVAFLLFAVLFSLAAVLASGKFGIWGRIEHFSNHRYFMPAIYIPLFLGWPVLLALWERRSAPYMQMGAAAGALAIIFCALPLFRYLPQVARLADYTSPFLQCADAEIKKRELRIGLANTDFASYVSSYLSAADGERLKIFSIFNLRALHQVSQRDFDVKNNPFVHVPLYRLWEWERAGKSPTRFDYIIANSTDERVSMQAPEIARCPWRLTNPETCYDYYSQGTYGAFIDGQTIVDYYGAPKEIFRCEGIDFYVYDNTPFQR